MREWSRNVTGARLLIVAGAALGIDADGRVRYSGPIDDCWFDARKAKNNFVRNAIDALLAGRKISNSERDVYSGGLIR